jgi:1-acyl-sn-glycerol-3-phosphate acyltransferase
LAYGYSWEKYKLKKGPYLILFNHVTTLDPFLVAMSFKRQLYFMASDDLFSVKFASPIIRFLVNPISKSKSFRDIQSIKDTIKVTKQGGIVSLAPEGNRTYSGKIASVDRSIVKLIKRLKAPVILYNIIGGFGVKPRFSSVARKGKTQGRINRVLEADDYLKMTDDELYKAVVGGLTVDDFNLGELYKSKSSAEYLERVFYLCPTCGEVGTLESCGNHFRCHNCGLDVEYLEDLRFKVHKSPNDLFKFETVYDYYKYQEDYIYNLEIKDKVTYFQDESVSLTYVVKNKKKVPLAIGKLKMDSKSISITSDDKEFIYTFNDITGMTVLGMNKLNFYIGKDIYQLKSGVRFNALKYMQLYYQIKNLENGVNHAFLGI